MDLSCEGKGAESASGMCDIAPHVQASDTGRHKEALFRKKTIVWKVQRWKYGNETARRIGNGAGGMPVNDARTMPGNEAGGIPGNEAGGMPGSEAGGGTGNEAGGGTGNEAASFYSTHAYLLLHIMHMYLLRPALA